MVARKVTTLATDGVGVLSDNVRAPTNAPDSTASNVSEPESSTVSPSALNDETETVLPPRIESGVPTSCRVNTKAEYGGIELLPVMVTTSLLTL